MHRLAIEQRQGAIATLVSPLDRAGFLRGLAARAPQLRESAAETYELRAS